MVEGKTALPRKFMESPIICQEREDYEYNHSGFILPFVMQITDWPEVGVQPIPAQAFLATDSVVNGILLIPCSLPDPFSLSEPEEVK